MTVVAAAAAVVVWGVCRRSCGGGGGRRRHLNAAIARVERRRGDDGGGTGHVESGGIFRGRRVRVQAGDVLPRPGLHHRQLGQCLLGQLGQRGVLGVENIFMDLSIKYVYNSNLSIYLSIYI